MYVVRLVFLCLVSIFCALSVEAAQKRTVLYDGNYTLTWESDASMSESINGGSEKSLTERHSHVVLSGGRLTATFTNQPPGEYTYTEVECEDGYCSYFITIFEVRAIGKLSAPRGPSTNASGSYTINWSNTMGSTTYQLQEKHGTSNWTTVYDGSSLNVGRSGRSSGTWSYQVRACASKNCGPWSSLKEVMVARTPSTPGTVSYSSTNLSCNSDFVVKWGAASGGNRYQLQERKRKQNANGSYGTWTGWSTLHSTISATSYARNNLAAAYEYDYQVRARFYDSGFYSDYSGWRAGQTISKPACNTPSSPSSETTERFDPSAYDVYSGDVNGDGIGDIYFRPKGQFILLHGDISIPLLIPSDMPHYVMYSYDEGAPYYGPPTLVDPLDLQNLTILTSGVTLIDKDNDGHLDLLISGSDLLYTVAIGSNGSAPTLLDEAFVALTPPPSPATIPAPPSSGASDAIGATSGQFRVDETGAATYSIPIFAAQGTAGVQPDISLDYNSRDGNGLVGQGWSIGGLSSISRCRQTLWQDGQAKAITWTDEDRFCLDGQRLIVDKGYSYGDVGATYRTEIDSFARIIAKGGSKGRPAYFEVFRKDGSRSHYGNTTDSENRADNGQALTWAINRFEDSVGNAIDYIYHNDGRGHRIDEIRYAYGNSSTAHARLTFHYEATDRHDSISGYVAGYPFSTHTRLASIHSHNTIHGSDARVRDYTLSYADDTPLSHMIAIRECAQGSCLPETQFSWSGVLADRGFSSTPANTFSLESSAPISRIGRYLPADINGDGLQDFVYQRGFWDESGFRQTWAYRLGSAEGDYRRAETITITTTEDEFVKWHMLDYNADGRSDLISYREGRWSVLLSLPKGHNNAWELTSNFTGGASTGITQRNATFTDINSDGLVDAVYSKGDTLYTRLLEIDTTQALDSERRYHFGAERQLGTLAPTPGTDSYSIYSIQAGVDFNGDGIGDLLVQGANRYTLPNPYTGPGYSEEPIDASASRYTAVLLHGNASFSIYYDHSNIAEEFGVSRDIEDDANAFVGAQSADFNNDGLTDIAYRRPKSRVQDWINGSPIPTTTAWYYRLNTGQGFSSEYALPDKASAIAFTDYNLDGYPDMYWRQGRNLNVSLWNANTNRFDTAILAREVSSSNDDAHFFFDFNGDGIDEYIWFDASLIDPNRQRFLLFAGLGSNYRDSAITAIDNGLGMVTDIDYEPLGITDHYQRLTVAGQQVCETLRFYYSYDGADHDNDYEQCYGESPGFYRALNGPWPLPTGSQTLGKMAPVLEFNGSFPVVTAITSTAPAAGTRPGIDASATSRISYYYNEAKTQASGRGFLGFQGLTTVDEQTKVETTTVYRQDFPFIGNPLSTTVRTASGDVLSRSDNTWKLKGWDTNSSTPPATLTAPYQPYLAATKETTYSTKSDSDGGLIVSTSALQTVTTSNAYDKHGNITDIKVVTESAGQTYTSTTEHTYDDGLSLSLHGTSFSYAELGRLTQTDVTTSRSDDVDNQAKTRRSRFTYYDSGESIGMLKTEVVEPDNDSLRVTSTHLYDGFGNATHVTQSGVGISSRSTVSSYDAQGRYLDKTTNTYGQVTQNVHQRNHLGQPTEVSDINGIRTHIAYGAFGATIQQASQAGGWVRTLKIACDATCPAGAQFIVHTTSASGGQTKTYIDALNRSVREATLHFDGTWTYIDHEYDAIGRLKRSSEPHSGSAQHWTTFTYDILGNVVKTQLPGISAPIKVAYDGLTTQTTNPLQQTKTEVKNGLGEPVKVIDNIQGQITYDYDALGNLRYTHSLGNGDTAASTIHVCYDLLGRKTAMRDPDKGGYASGASSTCPSNTNQAQAGWWLYTYNPFGELTQQIDAKGQISTLAYDELGRMITRTDTCSGSHNCRQSGVEGQASWTYNNATSGQGLGALLIEADDISGYMKTIDYDRFGRVSETTTHLGGNGDDNHYQKITYDQHGRTFQIFDAAGDGRFQSNAIEQEYNAQGYLAAIHNANTQNGVKETYYRVQGMDRRGNITQSVNGSGAVTTRDYNATTGRLEGLRSALGPTTLQDHSYSWDAIGNLLSRNDHSGTKQLDESFQYDDLNRLTRAQVAGRTAHTVIYNSLGNITQKTGVGNYTYGDNAGPHAVTRTSDGIHYTYDANGNLTSDTPANGHGGRNLKYTSFEKPWEIKKGGHTTQFKYGPDRMRFERRDSNAQGTTITQYIGSVEKIQNPDGSQEIKRYLPGNALVTISLNTNGIQTDRETQYLYKDHLGSIDVIADSTGLIAQELSFDAWGQRRNAQSWEALIASSLASFDHSVTTKGFTGHEMLDEVGLIHMNGRIYDARLGRFVQADIQVQFPHDTQSYNRYAYTHNNPLKYTDSSGYGLDVGGLITAAIGVVVSVACAGTCSPWVFAALGAAIGYSNAHRNGGNVFTGALTGAVTGYLGGSFGAGKLKLGEYVGLSAVAGGITAVLQDGQFGHGFVSAGIGTFVGSKLGQQGRSVGNFLASTVVGGTLSKLTGGKFANGATTAAFAYAVSAVAQSGTEPSYLKDDTGGADSLDGPVGDGVELYDGKIVVHASGEGATVSDEQLGIVKNDLELIFTRGGKDGAKLQSSLDTKKPLKIILNSDGENAAYLKGRVLTVDLKSNVKLFDWSPGYAKQFTASTTRVLAHEMGHALLGLHDVHPFMPYMTIGDTKVQNTPIVRFTDRIMRSIHGDKAHRRKFY